MDSTAEWHELHASDALKKLETTEKGLSQSEAEARLKQYGYNELQKKKGISKLQIFIQQFKNILVLILIAATIFSAFVGEFIDAAAIIIIVILNAIFGFVQEFKAEKTIEALKKLTSPETVVIRDGIEKKIDSHLVVPGDIVVLDEGSRVPADMRLIRIAELRIDEAMLTGESLPARKQTEPLKTASIADRRNLAYMGTLVTYGRGTGVVIGTGMATEMGKIAGAVQEQEEQSTPLQKKLSDFGRILGIIILVICAIVIVIGIIREGPLAGQPITETLLINMIIMGIALAVAAIPEGLTAVLTITLALGLQKLAKQNALMRKLPAVEALGSTTIICSDKTGTLTKNEMTISEIWCSEKTIDVTGNGYDPDGKFMFEGREISGKTSEEVEFLFRTGTLCNNASLVKNENDYGIIGDPTEAAIVVAAKKIGIEKSVIENKMKREHEIPFSSERKMMTTINASDKKYISCVKGAAEIVLNRCDSMQLDGKHVKLTSALREKIIQKTTEMTGKALRVLAVAYRDLDSVDIEAAEKNLILIGLVGMIDPPRDEAIESVKVCKEAGIRVIMITGDHKNTAAAVAKRLGILDEHGKVLVGEELDALSDTDFEKIVGEVSVYARVNPLHKLKIVDVLKKKGEIIAMTGDGVNDAPALKKADIGIAMGIKGTDVSKEASNMILSDDNFASIVSAVHEGRVIYDNIKKFIQYLLSCNVGEVMLILFAIIIGFTDPTVKDPVTGLSPIVLPLTAIQLLWINILTDGLPALAIGVDPAAPGIMKRRPRDPKEGILTKHMMVEIMFFGFVMSVVTLVMFSIDLQFGSTRAITTAFTTVVIIEMIRAHQVRMKYKISLFANKMLLLAIASSIALHLFIVYTPFMQPIFGTSAMELFDWIEILIASFFVLVVMWLFNKIYKGRGYD
ncbi:MAG: calcium-translocating P-type ATPase, SERCA-type [Candidatus Aenigmatarchaeota archaeon]